jgi:tripartite-type tricarboxylate transporter receptor subunit TctC
MADLLKQQVVVDNRGGAAGNIGVEVTVRANPDGYNFLLGNVGTMAINPVFYLKFPYKPLKDLIPVTQIVDVPGCLVVHPSLPAKNVKELIAHLKANPGKLNYGAPAPSSANALEMHMFLAATGTNAVQIAYKGGAGTCDDRSPRQRGADDVRDVLLRRRIRQTGSRENACRHLARAQSRPCPTFRRCASRDST